MAKIVSVERVIEYSPEFKHKVVELTHRLGVETVVIAEVLGLHPVMVYRWRQEYKEGRLTVEPSRRISMTKSTSSPPDSERAELKRLRKEVESLKKENAFLKKWDRYLKDRNRKDSTS